jgi:hypothetical protein
MAVGLMEGGDVKTQRMALVESKGTDYKPEEIV